MEQKKRRRRIKQGDVYCIDLGDSVYGYCIALLSPIAGFYDLRTTNLEQDLDFITSHPILFKVPIMKYSYKSDDWHYIGNVELNNDLRKTVYFFKQDPINQSISICYVDADKYTEIPATYEDVKDLERAAVWEPEHVEERLRDHFNGVPNISVEIFRPKPIVS